MASGFFRLVDALIKTLAHTVFLKISYRRSLFLLQFFYIFFTKRCHFY